MPTLLITGASRGLGLEFAKQYLDAGWSVIATCREPAKADALCKLAGDRLRVEALDVVDAAATKALATSLAGTPIDVLIANAGIYGPREYSPADFDEAVWGEVMRVNVMAPLRLAALLADSVAASTQKRMAFVSSQLGSMARNASGGGYMYRSSKAALNAVVKSLSIDLAKGGVVAAALHPGWVRTDMGGPNADIDAVTSVTGMRRVIDGLSAAQSGQLINYTGEPIPW